MPTVSSYDSVHLVLRRLIVQETDGTNFLICAGFYAHGCPHRSQVRMYSSARHSV